jgi:hypothetical protein
MRLSVKGLALALGVTWGAGVLFLGLAGAIGWGRALVEVLGSVYLGFAPTPVGSIIGTAWAFADGAVGGAVIAWVYNRLS